MAFMANSYSVGLEEQICVTDLESCEDSIAYEPHKDQYVACKKQFPTPSQPQGQCLMASWCRACVSAHIFFSSFPRMALIPA